MDERLFVRRLDDFDDRPLAGTAGARAPFFSADGRWIAFVEGGRLEKVPVDGGEAQPIADARARVRRELVPGAGHRLRARRCARACAQLPPGGGPPGRSRRSGPAS